MSDAAELRLFAEICRALSDRARDPDDKAGWLRLARKWQQMEATPVARLEPFATAGADLEGALDSR